MNTGCEGVKRVMNNDSVVFSLQMLRKFKGEIFGVKVGLVGVSNVIGRSLNPAIRLGRGDNG